MVGDVNGDGKVDVDDVNGSINIILGVKKPSYYSGDSDVNGDGITDVEDINAIINTILGLDKAGEGEEIYEVNGVKFKMINVQGGTFTMGATAEQGSDARDTEKPAHQVTLSSYSIGQTEVTQALWRAVMGRNPSYYQSSTDSDYGTNMQRPVEWVSWNDCQEFITKLNQLTGKQFRLPTEAEWEYAARGGNKSKGYKYSGSNTVGDVAWYWDNIPSQSSGTRGYGTQMVGSKAPNELGLYDMSGNVWEWCQDWYSTYSSDAQTNPTGSASGPNRVMRGGLWCADAKNCRVSRRDNNAPTFRSDSIGLRLAL